MGRHVRQQPFTGAQAMASLDINAKPFVPQETGVQRKRRESTKEPLTPPLVEKAIKATRCKPLAERKAGKRQRNSERQSGRWWTSLMSDDPISLEPLRCLKYEPFALSSRSGPWQAHHSVTHHFDGRVLADYLVRSKVFCHPITRRNLDRDECCRLDKYLEKNRFPCINVAYAYDHRNDPAAPNTTEQQPEARLEPGTILHMLFESNRTDDTERSRLQGANEQGQAARAAAAENLLSSQDPALVPDLDLTAASTGTKIAQAWSRQEETQGTQASARIGEVGWQVIDDDEELAIKCREGYAQHQQDRRKAMWPELDVGDMLEHVHLLEPNETMRIQKAKPTQLMLARCWAVEDTRAWQVEAAAERGEATVEVCESLLKQGAEFCYITMRGEKPEMMKAPFRDMANVTIVTTAPEEMLASVARVPGLRAVEYKLMSSKDLVKYAIEPAVEPTVSASAHTTACDGREASKAELFQQATLHRQRYHRIRLFYDKTKPDLNTVPGFRSHIYTKKGA